MQDYCSGSSTNGTFRVITENIPCGTTGTSCSKAIKLFIGVSCIYKCFKDLIYVIYMWPELNPQMVVKTLGVEFACSPSVGVAFLRVLQFSSPKIHKL